MRTMNTDREPEKFLFIILSFAASCVIIGTAFVLLYLMKLQLSQMSPLAFRIIEAVLWISVALFLSWFVVASVSALFEKRLFFQKKRPGLFHWLVPITMLIGRILKISEDQIAGSFIRLNNSLIQTSSPKLLNDRVLILLPHCLQNSRCSHKVVDDVANCHRCGSCDISDLKELEKKYQCPLYLTSGGTLARRIIKEIMPGAIIAVACEKELLSGITETWRIPVIGLTNVRPEGPCKNTRVTSGSLEEALRILVGNSRDPVTM